jgi:hypothetical protein
MKTTFIKIVIVVTIFFAITACDKDKQFTEYRTKFTGNFSFISYSYFSMLGYSTIYRDTIVYQGSINIDKEKDSVIIINYRPPDSGEFGCNDIKIYGSIIKPLIKYNGTLDGTDLRLICNISFSGSFQNTDSLSFNVGDQTALGLYRFGQVVTGKRK